METGPGLTESETIVSAKGILKVWKYIENCYKI